MSDIQMTIDHEHPSHNFSESMFRCYGCGCSCFDPALAPAECPTPDEVGQSNMSRILDTINAKLKKEFACE